MNSIPVTWESLGVRLAHACMFSSWLPWLHEHTQRVCFHHTLMVTVLLLFSTAVKEMKTSDSVAPGTAVHVHVYSIIYMCILYSSTHTGQHDVIMYLLIQYMYMLLVLSNVCLIASMMTQRNFIFISRADYKARTSLFLIPVGLGDYSSCL